jgi:HEAT repeat protein
MKVAVRSPHAPAGGLPLALALLLALGAAPFAQASSAKVDKLGGLLATHDSFKVRATAAVALGRLGDADALDYLSVALSRDNHFAVRAAAASALGRLQTPGGVPPLLTALVEDDDPFVHKEVLKALDQHHAAEHLEGFEEALDHDRAEVRRVAVNAFGEALIDGHTDAIFPVLAALSDEDAEVRASASRAIDGVSHDRALPLLHRGLAEGTPDERQSAAAQLAKRTDKGNVEPLLAALGVLGQPQAVRTELRRALKAHASLVDVDAARAEAAGDDIPKRVTALRLLASVQDPQAARLLQSALKSPEREVRAAAARGAADLATPQARGLLQSALKSEADARVKRQIELVLRTMR